MADDHSSMRPTCIPSSDYEGSGPAPAAAQRWPENLAAESAASITAASSPDPCMMSGQSDSRASSPAGPLMQAGTPGAREAQLLSWQRQQHERAMGAAGTAPVTPAAEIAAPIYCQSLQHQQHSTQQTPSNSESAQHFYPPVCTGESWHAGPGDDIETTGNRSSGLPPHSLHVQRPASTMHLSGVPPLAADSQTQASAQAPARDSAQHASPHLTPAQDGSLQDHHPQSPRRVQTALRTVPQQCGRLEDQEPSTAVLTGYSPASSYVGGRCGSMSPVLAAAGGSPDAQGRLFAAGAAGVDAVAAGAAVCHADSLPGAQHGSSSSSPVMSGLQQLMLRMLAPTLHAEVEPGTGAVASDASGMHMPVHHSAASSAGWGHEQAGAAVISTHQAQQGTGLMRMQAQPSPPVSSGQYCGVAGRGAAAAFSQLGGQNAGMSLPAVPADLLPSMQAAAVEGPSMLHSAWQLQPQQGIQAHGVTGTQYVPQQAVMASGDRPGHGHAQHQLQQAAYIGLYGPAAASDSQQTAVRTSCSAAAPAAPQLPSMHGAGGTHPYDSSAHDAAAAIYNALAAAAAQLHASPGATPPNLSAVEAAARVTQQQLLQAAGAPAGVHRELTLRPAAAGASASSFAGGPATPAQPAGAQVPPPAVCPAGQVLTATPPGLGPILQALQAVAQAAHAHQTSRAGVPPHTAAVAQPHVVLGTGCQQHQHAGAQGPSAAEGIRPGTYGHSSALGAAGRGTFDTSERRLLDASGSSQAPMAAAAAAAITPELVAPQQQQQQWGPHACHARQGSQALGCAGPVTDPTHAFSTVPHSLGADQYAGWSSPFAAAANASMPGAPFSGLASMYTQHPQQHRAAAAAVAAPAAAATPSPLQPQATGPYLPCMLPGPSLTLQQQQQLLLQQQEQVTHAMRLQQLQLLQLQLLGAAAGAPLTNIAAHQAAALQATPLLGMWGMGMSAYPGGLYPLMGHLQQHHLAAALWQGQPIPPTQHVLPAAVPQAAAASGSGTAAVAADGLLQNVAPPVHPGVVHSGDAAADATGDMNRSSSVQAAADPCRQLSRSGSIMSWLLRWMPLPGRRHSHAAAAQQLPGAVDTSQLEPDPPATDALVSTGTGMSVLPLPDATAHPGLAPDAWMLQATFPVAGPVLATVIGASSMVLQGWCFLGRTAVSASAWSALTLALTCVKISQYQLLLFLCCLTLLAAVGEAARSAVSAAVGAGRVGLRLADREVRLFARAAAVVAFTDTKQLCMLLATQPLLLLQSGPAHGQEVTAPAAEREGAARETGEVPNAEAATPTRTLSRALSQVLGSLLYQKQHSMSAMPRSSTSSSRRASIHAGEASSCRSILCTSSAGSIGCISQQVVIRPNLVTSAAVFAGQAASTGWHGPSRAEATVGLSRHMLVVYDSLAVVSGLWAGLWLRVWMLLALQAPLASCRIWMHAVSTGCCMSTAAAVASTRTALQAAWTLSHFSLVLLGTVSSVGPSMVKGATAANAPLERMATPASQRTEPGLSGMASTLPGPVTGVTQAAAWVGLQWLVMVWRPCCRLAWQAFAAVSWAVPGSSSLQGATHRFGGWAVNTAAAIVASGSSLLLWLTSLNRQTGVLFSRAGLRAVVVKAAQMSGLLLVWVSSLMLGLTERLAVFAADRLLQDLPPLARVGVYGSARMIKGLVVEAGQQACTLAAQLLAAWQVHGVA